MSEDTQAPAEENVNVNVTDTAPVSEVTPTTKEAPATEANEFEDFSGSKPKKTPKTPQRNVTSVKTTPRKKTDKVEPKIISPRQKLINKILRKAGIDEVPEMVTLFRGKTGKTKAISDIAIFIGNPVSEKDEVLKDIFQKCNKINTINYYCPLTEKRIIEVGGDILKSGKLHHPIQVAEVIEYCEQDENHEFQCTSGRHRLALFAILYGMNAKIPVILEKMPLTEAIDAVPYANGFSRPTTSAEKSEHHAMIETNGQVKNMNSEEIYGKFSSDMKKFFVYAHYNKLMDDIAFPVGPKGKGGVCTEGALKAYCHDAVRWNSSMTFEEFMTRLNDSITFLNAYQSYCSEYEGYSDETDDKGKVIAKGSRHNVMGSKCLGGVGKYYRHLQDSNKTNIENADELASITTGMRNIANMQSKILFEELLKIVTVVD